MGTKAKKAAEKPENRAYNITWEVQEGRYLMLDVDLDAALEGLSSTGKTYLVACSHGSIKLPNGDILSLNVYRPKANVPDDDDGDTEEKPKTRKRIRK